MDADPGSSYGSTSYFSTSYRSVRRLKDSADLKTSRSYGELFCESAEEHKPGMTAISLLPFARLPL